MSFRDLSQFDPISLLRFLFQRGGPVQQVAESAAANALDNPVVQDALRYASYADVPFDAVRTQFAPLVEDLRYGLSGYPSLEGTDQLTRQAADVRGFGVRVADQFASGHPYEPQASFGLAGDMALDPLNWVAPGAGAAVRAGHALGLSAETAERLAHAPGLRRIADLTSPPPVSRAELPRRARDLERVTGNLDALRTTLRDRLAVPENRARFDEMVRLGMERGGHTWYADTRVYDAIREALGDETKAREFYNVLAALVAATSPQNPVPTNIRQAMNLMDEVFRGATLDDLAAKLADNPTLTGRVFPEERLRPSVDFHGNTVRQAMDEGELTGQKISSFLANFLGDSDAVTIDTHNLRQLLYAAGMDWRDPQGKLEIAQLLAAPNPEAIAQKSDKAFREWMYERVANAKGGYWYSALEDVQRELASELGLTPRELQAVLWVGGAELTGVRDIRPFTDIFMEEVGRAATELGTDMGQLIRDIYDGRLRLNEVLSPSAQRRLARMAAGVFEDEDEYEYEDELDFDSLRQALELGGYTTGRRY